MTDSTVARYILSRLISRDNPASSATFKTIEQWMTKCLTSHLECRRRVQDRQNETFNARWLDLTNTRSSGLVVLVSGASISAPFNYTALSYVWGSSQLHSVHQTTIANIQNHTRGLVLAAILIRIAEWTVFTSHPRLRMNEIPRCFHLVEEYLEVFCAC